MECYTTSVHVSLGSSRHPPMALSTTATIIMMTMLAAMLSSSTAFIDDPPMPLLNDAVLTAVSLNESALDVCPISQLGKGSSGSVFRGQYNGADVAVKRPLKCASITSCLSMHRLFEIEMRNHIWASANISDRIIRRPYVCHVVAADIASRTLVLEYFNGGDLSHHIASKKFQLLDADEILLIVGDMVRGLAVLEERELVHLDLRTPNILVQKNARGKAVRVALADFGWSVFSGYSNGGVVHTRLSLDLSEEGSAPECWDKPSPAYTTAANVFAFGTMLESMLGRFEKFSNAANVSNISKLCLGLDVIVSACKHGLPSRRATPSMLIKAIDALKSEFGSAEDSGEEAEEYPPSRDDSWMHKETTTDAERNRAHEFVSRVMSQASCMDYQSLSLSQSGCQHRHESHDLQMHLLRANDDHPCGNSSHPDDER